MLIRELQPAELQRLEAFVFMAAFSPEHPPPQGAAQSPHVRRWLDHWPIPAGLAVGAEVGGRTVGVALARAVEPALLLDAAGVPSPEVLIAVEPAHRGRGVGRSLLEALLERSRAEHVPTLVLTVSEHNRAAAALYRRVGFEEIRRDGERVIMARVADQPPVEEPNPKLRLAVPSDSRAIAEFRMVRYWVPEARGACDTRQRENARDVGHQSSAPGEIARPRGPGIKPPGAT